MSHAPAAPSEAALDGRLVKVGVAVVLGGFMSVLDTTIVNVATRTLGQVFDASIPTIQWVLTGYLLSFAAVIPITGWASERFGARRVWIGALLLFMAGSALSGAAWSASSLIAFRILQGIGGGMIPPLAQAILAQAAGPRRMARALSMVAVPTMLGTVSGPVVGGFIVSTAGWRWIFFVNLPVGAVAILLAYRLLPNTRPQLLRRLDLRGVLLLSSGVATFVYGLSAAGAHGGISDPRFSGGLGTGLALVVLYVVHARARGRLALIDISLLRIRGFATAVAANFAVTIALIGVVVLQPLYWQIVRGETPLMTGLLLTPQALGVVVAMPLAARMTDKAGAAVVTPIGLIPAILGTTVYTQITATTPYATIVVALFMIGLGQGATLNPLTAAAYTPLPHDAIPRATSALHTIKRLGASIGTAALAIVLDRAINTGLPRLGRSALEPLPPGTRARIAPALAHAFALTFWVAFALLVIALIPVMLLPRKPAPAALSPAIAAPVSDVAVPDARS
jgi:EmrB/QacA subfamily drug resistance transporter